VPSLHPDYPDGPPYRWLRYHEETPPMSAPAALIELLSARLSKAKPQTTPRSQAESPAPDSLEATIQEGLDRHLVSSVQRSKTASALRSVAESRRIGL